ncbi:MAG: glutathione S-transferase N-terminal domain-containing protein, partial [Parvibaculales bacterium]
MIELYTSPTPNGYKASVTLEELDMAYNVHVINLQEDDQKTPEFLAMNPNGRIPVIIDPDFDNLAIFETGAIMVHLAEKAGRLLP